MIPQNDVACDGRRVQTTPPKRPNFLAGVTDSSDYQCATETLDRRTIGTLQYAFQKLHHPTVTG